jgi:hypothetical protein
VPEKSAMWIELLRMEWARDTVEEARYLEEMTRMAPIGSADVAEEPEDEYEKPEGLPPGVFVDPKKFAFKKAAAAAAASAPPSSTTTMAAAAPAAAPAPVAPQTKKFVFKKAQLLDLPDALKALFGPADPKTEALRLLPSSTGTITPFLGLFSATAAELGLDPRATEFTDTVMKALVKKSLVPIVQYDFRTEPPTVNARRLANDKDAKGYPVFVLQPDQPPALVVVASATPPRPPTRQEVPDALYRQFMAGVKVFGVKLA